MYLLQPNAITAEASPTGELDASLLRSGDPQTTEAALTVLVPLVRRWLYRLLGPVDILDDAVQEALTEICDAFHSFKGHSALTTFAHRITVRTAYRYFSTPTDIRPLADVDDAAVTGDTPESSAASRQLLRLIYRCLDRLPTHQRVAFVLCAVEGHTPGEAAKIVGTLPVTMRSRLKRARTEIWRQIAKDETALSAFSKWRSE